MAEMKEFKRDERLTRNDELFDKFGARPVNPELPLAEKPVHTYGSVALMSTYGSDDMIVEAARVSYGKGTTTVRDTKNLIRYLMRHKHTSPFEMAELTFYLRLPIFVVRQLIRHRTANVNEYSARYSQLSDDYYVPTVAALAKQSTDNKQGRGEPLTEDEAGTVQQLFVDAQETCLRTYHDLLEKYGVAREIARVPTSVGMYSEMYWKCDLHNFMHFLKLRLDAHAQQEIRDFADAMYELARPYFRHSFQAFEDYNNQAYTLSALEIEMLKETLGQFRAELHAKQWPTNSYGMSSREYSDFCHFLDTLVAGA
jgi:thymidylate synthase (FAD)